MADRLMMVTELGLLAQQAALRGDDRAAGLLRDVAGHLMDAHGDLLKLEERRRKDRQRPRRQPPRTTESAESAESADKSGFPSDSPSSKSTKRPPLNRAREAGLNVDLVDGDGVPLIQVEEIDEAVARVAVQFPVAWPSVSAFLCRRPLRTWMGWIKEIKKLLVGSQYTEEDMATTCDHDAALSRPIGSPFGLAGFINKTRIARMNPPNLEREAPRRNGKHPNPGAQQVANILGRSE